MFKKLCAFFLTMLIAVAAFAAADANKATEAELDAIKGIGPVTSKLIMAERKKSEFKNWEDFISRVKGVGEVSAAKFSDNGLTVGGTKYTPTAKATKDAKPAASKPVVEKAKDAAVATKEAVKDAAVATKDAVKDTAKDVKAAVTPAPAAAPVAAKPATAAPAAKPASAAASAAKK